MYLSQDLDDAALVDRCRAGDSAAFGMLAERHRRVLQSVAYRLLGDREDAKDATQTTFVKALEHLDGYDPSRRFFSWVYAILRNECLNMLRARREAGPIDGELARGAGPLEAAEAAERHRHVQAALLALPVEQREVVVLRHFAGLSYEEIARAVGVPAKTVKSRLFTGRQRLGELLLGWEAQ